MSGKQETSSAERILRAALTEFSSQGFSGARVERIARKAKVNKAMIFYHFGSKRGLFQTILQETLAEIFRELGPVISTMQEPATFLEAFPRIYIRHFSRRPERIRLIGLLVMQEPQALIAELKEIVERPPLAQLRPLVWQSLARWHSEGKLREADPRQVMLSVVGLSLFSFIGLPLVEVFSGHKIEQDEDFIQRRIEGVIQLLKRGLLP